MNKILLGMAAASAMFMATTASATFMSTIDVNSDNTIEVTAIDDVLNDTSGSTAGLITTSYIDPTVSLTTVLGTSKPIESGSPQILHLNTTFTTFTGAGSVTVMLSDTDFTGDIDLTLSGGGSALDDVTIEAWMGLDNAEFSMDTLLGSYSFSDGGFTMPHNLTEVTSTPYSLTLVATFSHNSSGTSSSDTAIDVPEPSVIALFGLGLFGLGLVRRRVQK